MALVDAPPLPDPYAQTKGTASSREMAASIATPDPNQRTRMNRIDSGQPGKTRLLVSEASCTGDSVRREALLRKALASAQAQFGEKHPETAYAMIALGDFDRQHNNPEEGQRLLTDALAIYQKLLGRANPEVRSLQQEIDRAH
jgi:hypothetical protein